MVMKYRKLRFTIYELRFTSNSTMKRFLIPIIIFAIIFWLIWLCILNFSSPFQIINHNSSIINTSSISFFLTTLFFALSFTLAIILYFFYCFLRGYPKERRTFRRGLRQSFFVVLGVITLAILQLAGTLNLLTFILTVAIVIALS